MELHQTVKTIVTYPVPCDSVEVFDLFYPFMQRFAKTWRMNPPGANCDLILVLNKCGPTRLVYDLFQDIAFRYEIYNGNGADAGSHQFVCREERNAFQVTFTSRAYFFQANWLARLKDARLAHGPALYGMSASHEGGKLHVCGRGMAFDTEDFRNYPVLNDTRDKGVATECGKDCILDWFEGFGRPAYIVGFDKVYSKPDWFTMPNRFRTGDQSNMLAWDKHTDAWLHADQTERERLTRLSEGPP